jgi:hypothetical protein
VAEHASESVTPEPGLKTDMQTIPHETAVSMEQRYRERVHLAMDLDTVAVLLLKQRTPENAEPLMSGMTRHLSADMKRAPGKPRTSFAGTWSCPRA